MKTWISADYHFGEDRFKIMGRPFKDQLQHVTAIVDRHNALIEPSDRLIVVGDVVYSKTPEYLSYMENIQAKEKILIRGNHDRNIPDEEFLKYFSQVIPEGEGIELEATGPDGTVHCYLTHYPSMARQDRFNLVGHIHGAWRYQLNMLNVGVDAHHFYPVNLDDVPFHFTAICKYYDEDVWSAYNPVNATFKGFRGMAGTYFKK